MMKQSIKVWQISEGQLIPGERDLPDPAQGEVLVKVSGIGLNRADILQRKGKYPPPPGASDLPGLEISGRIAETGEKICALLPGGGYAEYVTVPKSHCLPVPDLIDLPDAAALPEAMFTVAKNIFILGQLRENDHLLVHGGASGIGTMAIQMAKAKGARISVTAGSDERCRQCIQLGADRAINYKSQKFEEILKDDPVDVVLDMVGGDYPGRAMPIMNKQARHVNIAFMGAALSEISIPLLMQKNLTFTGSTLRGDSLGQKADLSRFIEKEFWPLVENGVIKPVIDRVFPFSEAPQAHDEFEKNSPFGKILLKI